MGHKVGDFKKPQYQLDNELLLDLRRITQGTISLWSRDYEKKHVKPVPPIYTMTNGEEDTNEADPHYVALLEQWTNDHNFAFVTFMLTSGVLNKMPEGYIPLIEDSDNPRLAWLMDVAGNELDDLQRAIIGLDIATEQGVADAEKN